MYDVSLPGSGESASAPCDAVADSSSSGVSCGAADSSGALSLGYFSSCDTACDGVALSSEARELVPSSPPEQAVNSSMAAKTAASILFMVAYLLR